MTAPLYNGLGGGTGARTPAAHGWEPTEDNGMKWKMTPNCPPDQVVAMRPMRAMREKCLDCCCGQAARVRDCTITGCAIWLYRHGRNPNRKGRPGKPLTDAHKDKLAEGRAKALAMRGPGTDSRRFPTPLEIGLVFKG